MAKWIRFEQNGNTASARWKATRSRFTPVTCLRAQSLPAKRETHDVKVLTPCEPSKMVCLWNNFHELAAKNDFQHPTEPLYFIKAPNAYHPHGEPIRRPSTYDGKIVYEGELGVVIGKKCSNISEAEAGDYIFGYTCVNDVTAVDLMKKFPTFDQWARAKSFDTFGVFGPVIVTGVDPMKLRSRPC